MSATKKKSGAYGEVVLDAQKKTACKYMPLDEGHELPYYIVREAAILRKCERLQVPNVVRLRTVSIDGDKAVLEFPLYATDLYDFLYTERNRAARIRVADLALWNISMAFAYLHRYQILYRDGKPSNMLLSRDQKDVVLADFGATREISLTETASPVKPGALVASWDGLSPEVCTHLYAPPEAFSCAYTEKADIYSLGASVFQVICGRVFDNKQLERKDVLDILELYRGSLSKTMFRVVSLMLETDPEKRPTAVETLEMLQDGTTFTVMPPPASPAPVGNYGWVHRKDVVKWIFDRCNSFGQKVISHAMIIYMVQLLDEFMAISRIWPVSSLQRSALAMSTILLILKYHSNNAPSAATFVETLHMDKFFTATDLLSWERLVFVTLNGNLIPRPIPRILRTCDLPAPHLRWVLSRDDYLTDKMAALVAATQKMQ